MTEPKESSGSRLTIITVDQLISGASNVLIALIAAHVLSASNFGLFAIVFLVYTILVGVSRGIVSDPLLVHPVESQERRGEVIGTGWIVAIPLAGGLLAVALAIQLQNAGLGAALLVLAACLPLLVIQDVGRYLGYAVGRPERAVVLDSVWFVVMLGGVAGLAAADLHTLPAFIAVWGGSGALAGLLVFHHVRLRELRFGFAWLRHTWTMSWQFLVSYVALQGTALGMSSEVGAIDGTRALGGVQGASLLTRPFSTFVVAVMASGIGQVAREASDIRRVRRLAVKLAAVAGGAALINTAGMLAVPHGLGHLLLGHAWGLAHPLLLPTGIGIVCVGLIAGPQSVLLGVRATRKAMAINLAAIPILLIGTVIGAEIDGARGALWLAAAGWALITVAWWVTYEVHTRRAIASTHGGIELTSVSGTTLAVPPAQAQAQAVAPSAAVRTGIVLSPVTRTGASSLTTKGL